MTDPVKPAGDPVAEIDEAGLKSPSEPVASPPPMDPAAVLRARRNRNMMLGLSLLAFIVIVYLVTVLRMGGYVAQRPL